MRLLERPGHVIWATGARLPSLPRSACLAHVVAAQFPNYTYGANVGVHDLRMYVGQALDANQARKREGDWGRAEMQTGRARETASKEGMQA